MAPITRAHRNIGADGEGYPHFGENHGFDQILEKAFNNGDVGTVLEDPAK